MYSRLNSLSNSELEALAYDEAMRLMEASFSFYNPYSCTINTQDIPFDQIEQFCAKVEEELLRKGETIHRQGQFFKIDRYNK